MSYKDFHDRYPYSNKTKQKLKKEKISFDDFEEGGEVFNNAAKMIIWAYQGKDYSVFEDAYLAYPIAKLILYHLKNPFLQNKFADMFASFLDKDNEIHYSILEDFAINYTKEKDTTILPLCDYLKTNFKYAEKLVNINLDKGEVFLDKNETRRYIKGLVFNKVFPLPENNYSTAKKAAKELSSYLKRLDKEKRKYLKDDSFSSFSSKTKMKISNYPPCMSKLFADLKEGKKLSHMGHFSLASFLKAVGWKKEDVLNIYKQRPDYNEKIADYQLSRIWEKDIAPPSCEKLKAYNLCPGDCGKTHPLKKYGGKNVRKK